MARSLLRHVDGVRLLHRRGVLQHDAREISGGVRGVDVAAESLLHQVWKIAAVIDVGVAQHHGVQRVGIEGEVPVAFDRVRAAALVQTAFEKEFPAVDLQKVHRSRGGSGGPEKVDVHATNLSGDRPSGKTGSSRRLQSKEGETESGSVAPSTWRSLRTGWVI